MEADIVPWADFPQSEILQAALPQDLALHPLPGTRPMPPGDWLRIDDAFAGQMALRDALLARRRDTVTGLLPEGRAAADELLATVLEALKAQPGYAVGGAVTRPDGVRVPVDRDDPIGTLLRLCQEDLCILQHSPEGHRLVAAALCFPGSWTLAQKLGRPLVAIHRPIEDYTDDMARRVQRLFDGVQVGRPLVRFNRLDHCDPWLHQPRLEGTARPPFGRPVRYVRVERQGIVRLPRTRGIVFSIHTTVIRRTADQAPNQDPKLVPN